MGICSTKKILSDSMLADDVERRGKEEENGKWWNESIQFFKQKLRFYRFHMLLLNRIGAWLNLYCIQHSQSILCVCFANCLVFGRLRFWKGLCSVEFSFWSVKFSNVLCLFYIYSIVFFCFCNLCFMSHQKFYSPVVGWRWHDGTVWMSINIRFHFVNLFIINRVQHLIMVRSYWWYSTVITINDWKKREKKREKEKRKR